MYKKNHSHFYEWLIYSVLLLWSHLGLNQGPPDYESGATNQLSYRTPQNLFLNSFAAAKVLQKMHIRKKNEEKSKKIRF